MMTLPEIDRILGAVVGGELAPRAAVAQLRAAGHLDAEDLVFFALGGATTSEVGPDGRERYPSGRLVADVEADMAR